MPDLKSETSAPAVAALAPSRRYLVNAVLFVLVSLAAFVWYELHLKVFTTIAVVGTGLSVATATAFALAKLEKLVGESVSAWFRRLLGGKRATLVFSVALGISILALVTTFSVRLVGAVVPADGQKFEFDVGRVDAKTPSRIVLTKDHLSEPMIYFGIRPVKLRIETRRPPIYRPFVVAASRGGVEEARVMTDDLRKDVRLVRLFPGGSLFHHLYDDSPHPGYSLQILRDGQPFASLHGLQFETLWIGGSREELDWYRNALQQDEKANREMHDAFVDYLQRPENAGNGENAIRNWLQEGSRALDSAPLSQRQKLTFIVTARGQSVQREITIGDRTVTNAFMEGPE